MSDSFKFNGSDQSVVPVALLIDPFMSSNETRVWSILRSICQTGGQGHFIAGSTYTLPKLAALSRQTYINSCDLLTILRWITVTTETDETGFITGKTFQLNDYPQTVRTYKSIDRFDEYKIVLERYCESSNRKIKTIAQAVYDSLNDHEPSSLESTVMINRCVRDYLNTDHIDKKRGWMAGIPDGMYPISSKRIPETLGKINKRKSTKANPDGSLNIRPPEGPVVQKLDHGSLNIRPPDNEGSLNIRPLQNQQLTGSLAGARDVVSSCFIKTSTNKEINKILKVLEAHQKGNRFSEKQSEQIFKVIQDLDTEAAIDIIDEVAGRVIDLSSKGDQLNNPAGYAFRLKAKLDEGEFVPSLNEEGKEARRNEQQMQAHEAYLEAEHKKRMQQVMEDKS